LKDSAIEVLKATSVQQGLSLIERRRPEVLLLNIKLPDMSGLEIARQVRAMDPTLPVAYITASDASDVAIQAMQAAAEYGERVDGEWPPSNLKRFVDARQQAGSQNLHAEALEMME
jgi:DNA-binding NtrC family response regulator